MKRTTIDCRDLIIKCGIKHEKADDGSLFIKCPNAECEQFCVRVSKHEFFSFETGLRGDIYALAHIINWQDKTGISKEIIGLRSELYTKVLKLISSK